MADNVGYTPGSGEVIATDDVAGVQYQRIKVTDGAADSTTPMVVRASNPTATDAGAVVRQSPCDIWSVSFANTASSLVATEMTQRSLGTGMGVTQANSTLLVTTGTTTNSEFLARSTRSFRVSFIERHQTVLSQRIANNNFAVLMADRVGEGLSCTVNSTTSISVTLTGHGFTSENVGQSMFVGAINGVAGVPGRYAIASIPDANTINFTVAGWPASGSCTLDLFGWNYIRTLYTATTATNAAVDAQRRGWNSGDTTATISTTASPGHMMQMTADGRNVYFADTLVASDATPSVTMRAHRVVNLPDDDVDLFLYMWAWNGTTAPASTTTWTVGFVSVESIANVPIYLAGIRPQGSAAPLSVSPVTTTSVTNDVGIQYRTTATGAATPTIINSPTTPAVQTIKGSAGRLIGLVLLNTDVSTRFFKVFNVVTPTLGTSNAVLDVALPTNVPVQITLDGGVAFSTAITCAVTGGRGATNNAAITGNEVTGFTLHA